MTFHSTFRSLLARAVALTACAFAFASAGCETGVQGVDACRELENARCVAGVPCGLITDVDACKRFYRDHCLHGVATPAEFSSAEVTACAGVVTRAGDCQSEHIEKADDCFQPTPPETFGALTVCDIVEEPEVTPACAFLTAE